MSAPPVAGQSFYYMSDTPLGGYVPLNPMDSGTHSSESSTPQYEQLQPVPMEYAPHSGTSHLGGADDFSQTLFTHADDLDVWDQIKSRVDGPFTHSRVDELDVARIAADLKRSAEESQATPPDYGYHQLQGMFPGDQLVVESKKPVELAEADSTFCEELDEAE